MWPMVVAPGCCLRRLSLRSLKSVNFSFLFFQVKYGVITYDTTFENYTMLTGNVVSLFLGGIICAVVSFIFPEDYDFLSMRQIKVMDVAEDGDLGFAKVSLTFHSSRFCLYYRSCISSYLHCILHSL